MLTDWNGWSADAKSAVSRLNVHTYGTSDRTAVRDIAKTAGKDLWMSEVEGDWSGSGFDPANISNGLGMASHIIDDLRELEPSAWVFWQPVEDLYNMQKVENLNWGSVYVDFDCDANGNSKRRLADGSADPSCHVLTNAKYNAVRNFTHYIRPGDRLIPSGDDQTTAAIAASGDAATLVHVNSDAAAQTVTIDLSRFGAIAPGAIVTPVTTTQSPASDVEANALVKGAPIAVDAATKSATVTVPAKSITTLIVSGISGVSASAPQLRDGKTYQLMGVQSGKALNADPSTLTIRSAATTADAAKAQAWTVRTIDGAGTDREKVTLTNGDGRLLGVSGTSTALVAPTGADPATDPSLQWIVSTTDGSTFTLTSVAAQRALDVNGQSTADGGAVGTWPSNNGANQRWTLADTAVTGVKPVTAATLAGAAPVLPSQVTLTYAGGTTRQADVSWDLAGVDWTTLGTRTVTGHGTDLFGSPFTASAQVEIGGYSLTDPVSVTVYAGATASQVKALAPATVPAHVGSQDATFPAQTTWDFSTLTDAALAKPGIVVLGGAAASNDPTAPSLPASLSVIVTAATEVNVAPRSKVSATFTESSSYSADRTINGLTTDKGWSNWRSGTKDAQDTLTYVLDGPQRVRHVKTYFYKDGGSNSWPQTMSVEYRTGSGAWTSAGTVNVPIPAGGAAPVVDVPLPDAAADQVRVVMNAYPATHMIVSEVEIYAVSAGPSGVADLAALRSDGRPLDGFSADRTAYDLTTVGSSWPTLYAVPVDGGATVAVTQPKDAGGAAAVRVTAPDGTQRSYTIAVTRQVALPAPTISGAPLLGETLSAASGTTDPAAAAVSFQWTRDGAPIGGGPTHLVSEADLGHAITVSATAAADGFAPATAVSSAVVPTEVASGDGQPGAPGVAVLSSDNGWDTGLLDGDYSITMNLWWGTNGTLFKLYENGSLVAAVPLKASSAAGPQTASVPLTGRVDGRYVYTGELVNAEGRTAVRPLAVTVKDAAPGTPVLSSDDWDRDGTFTLAADLWWGTNATSYTFREGSTVIGSGSLNAATPDAQRATVAVSGAAPGTHTYTVTFTNAAGSTTSKALSVKVR
jgi:hypothetical protein